MKRTDYIADPPDPPEPVTPADCVWCNGKGCRFCDEELARIAHEDATERRWRE